MFGYFLIPLIPEKEKPLPKEGFLMSSVPLNENTHSIQFLEEKFCPQNAYVQSFSASVQKPCIVLSQKKKRLGVKAGKRVQTRIGKK